MAQSGKNDGRTPQVEGECIIPAPLPPEALGRLLSKGSEDQARAIRDYVEWQAPDEKVVHLEKVATERVFERDHDVWDVWTDKSRNWVITSPTNIYLQEHFPSLDVALSFHIGLMARVMARRAVPVDDEPRQRLAGAWRRWMQATETLDAADEAEQFQAAGMQCRETLLELVRAVADPVMVPAGQAPPKAGDFLHWSEHIANTIARGESAYEVRSYLKEMAKATWQMAGWLTHANGATRADARLTLDATMNVLAAFGDALVRHERGAPDRCPKCASYRLRGVYRPDLGIEPPYITLCEKCGWGEPQRRQRKKRAATKSAQPKRAAS